MSFECWTVSHFIWSHRIAASLGNCSLHPIVTAVCVIPSHLNSSHLMSSQFFHLIASYPISCLLSLSQLFSADRNCSVLFSCRLSFSHLFSSHLGLSPLSQVFAALLNSSQLSAGHVSSSYVFSPLLSLLTSSKLFSHLLSWTQLLSARLTSSPLFSTHAQIISALIWPKPAPETDLSTKPSDPCAFHREDFTQRSLYTCTENLVHTEAFTQRQGSFYSQQAFAQQAFTQGKLLHRNLYIEKLLNAASFEALSKRNLKGKSLAPKLRKSVDKTLSLSQPWGSHSNTIYDAQVQKTIVLRTQPRQQATLTQPLECDLQPLSCKAQ